MLLCRHKRYPRRDRSWRSLAPWLSRWASFLSVWLWRKTNKAVTYKQSSSVQKMFSWHYHTPLLSSIQNTPCYPEDEKYRLSLCVRLALKCHLRFSQLITSELHRLEPVCCIVTAGQFERRIRLGRIVFDGIFAPACVLLWNLLHSYLGHISN